MKRILTALVTAFFATSAFCSQVVNNAIWRNGALMVIENLTVLSCVFL